MTPFVHVATGADFASPFANAGDQGLGYINSDVTLYLHRLPVTRWVGFEVVNHHATDGVAIGECWLYDEQGPIGTSTVAALAQRKPMALQLRPALHRREMRELDARHLEEAERVVTLHNRRGEP